MLGHVADLRRRGLAFLWHSEIRHPDSTGARFQKTTHHLDERRLPCPVRAQKTKDLAPAYAQINIVDRDKIPKTPRYAAALDGESPSHNSPQ